MSCSEILRVPTKGGQISRKCFSTRLSSAPSSSWAVGGRQGRGRSLLQWGGYIGFFSEAEPPSVSYLAAQRIRRQTTWSCRELWMSWIPSEGAGGWASSGGTPGAPLGARCQQCRPTGRGQRGPGRQTCPLSSLPCAAARPPSSPCSVWWSPPHSPCLGWWSGQRSQCQLSEEREKKTSMHK